MPELPEVETTVAGLKHPIQGKTIVAVDFHRDAIRYPLKRSWVDTLRGSRIQTISRRAKLIVMELDKAYLLWHLGMSGSLRISRADEAKRKHDHVEIHLSGGKILRFHDPRRFGYLKLVTSKDALLDSFSNYGVEPLSAAFDGDYLYQRSRHKKQPVKNFIMDQSVVVGVGNIYACEALFLAGIRPQTPAGKIGRQRYLRLVKNIKTVLEQAIAQGGTTLKDFENAEAKPGYFQQFLYVYGREFLPCLHCQTPIATKRLGGRNSFYCKKCQR